MTVTTPFSLLHSHARIHLLSARMYRIAISMTFPASHSAEALFQKGFLIGHEFPGASIYITCCESAVVHSLQRGTEGHSVNRNDGERSPIGARVLPVSHSSWYFSICPSRRPSARALFSQMQYALQALQVS